MAHSVHQSSSPQAPSTLLSNKATSFSNDLRMVDGVQYRRNVFVDGDLVRISETPRRRRPREVHAGHVSAQDASNPSNRSSEMAVSQTNSAAARQSPIIHQSTCSPVGELSSRTRHDSLMDTASSANSGCFLPPGQSLERSHQHFELSPLPTPRTQRLPTPDLELLRVDSFCDCQTCHLMSALSIGENGEVKTDMAHCHEGTGLRSRFDKWYHHV